MIYEQLFTKSPPHIHMYVAILTTVPATFDGRQLSDWDDVQQLHGGTVRLRFGGLRGGAPKAGVLKRPASIMLRSSSASAGSGHWPISDNPDLVSVSDSSADEWLWSTTPQTAKPQPHSSSMKLLNSIPIR